MIITEFVSNHTNLEKSYFRCSVQRNNETGICIGYMDWQEDLICIKDPFLRTQYNRTHNDYINFHGNFVQFISHVLLAENQKKKDF